MKERRKRREDRWWTYYAFFCSIKVSTVLGSLASYRSWQTRYPGSYVPPYTR